MTRPPHHAGRALPGESDCSQGNRQMLSRVGGLLQQILLGTVLSWLPLPNGPLSFRGLQAEESLVLQHRCQGQGLVFLNTEALS